MLQGGSFHEERFDFICGWQWFFFFCTDLFGSGGKKKKVGLARTRKALADKTNDSETSSGLMTPMTLVKEEGGGEQMSCCYYRSTPYPKLHDDLHEQEAAALPEEQVLYTQVS
jgi:hypothetical protein